MSIEFDIELHGMEEVEAVFAEIAKFDGLVELRNVSRRGGEMTNSEIMEWLKDNGKDYTTLSAADRERIAKAYMKELDKDMQASFNGRNPKNLQQDALKKAMEEYMDIVADKVEAGGSVRTGQLRDNLRRVGSIKIKKQ